MDPQKIIDRLEFALTRYNRSAIQDYPAREHLLVPLPLPASACPVRELLFRRAGIRIATLSGE